MIDAVVAEVLGRSQALGVDGILLKGRSITRLLYREDEPRNYVDGDILIREADRSQAESLLGDLGFERKRDSSWIEGWTNPSEPWVRLRDGAMIDLHMSIPGVGVGAAKLWSVLSSETDTMQMAGASITILSPPALALHLALHVAQHEGKMDRPTRDLELAIARLDTSTWEHAVRVAAQLEAIPALALGLATLPEGVSLGRVLGLPPGTQAERTIQGTRLEYSLRALRTAPTWGARAQMLRSKMLPSPDFMRSWSRLASRGRVGLGLAYVWRPLWLIARSFTALRERQKARSSNGR